MTISKIDQLEPIQPGKKAERNNPVTGIYTADSINLSSEALQRAEAHQIIELVKAVPEMSEIRIAELRQKINDPAYINEGVINITAERILSAFNGA
ncbi:MAG: flagellar biosynthesis anti-sigma factor FlgM [Spirochaetes bacterium]|nr:flagellar biosynthesis anti-sigma factor FlgM [Spirochaetota bacterium]